MSNLKKIEEQLQSAPNVRAMLQLDIVQKRFIANYQATTRKTDGEARFQNETFALMEIINENPALQQADRFSIFAAIIKAGTTGLSFRDNKLYVMPGNNKTIKVQSSPAGKREMMENMENVKSFPEAQVVVKGDIFIVDKLNGVVVQHSSTDKSVEPTSLDNIVASYQRIKWTDGTINDVVVTHGELLKAKSKSKIKGELGVWGEWPGEAAKKTATNRAYNRYHKYPDGIITFGKDSDKEDEDNTADVSHQEVAATQETAPPPVQEEIQEAEVVAEEPKIEKKKKASGISDLINE